jgi:hypothetical protein
MRRVIGPVRGATRKVYQLTGETDRERGVPCLNETESRFGIFGTDLGSSFEHGGRLWFLFGDTVSSVGYDEDLRPEAGDCIAYSMATSGEDGVGLTFLTAPDGHYLSPRTDPLLPRGPFNVPLDGFSAGGQMYVWFSTDADLQATGGVKMGRCVWTRLADEQQARFTYLYTLSDLRQGGRFVNVSTSVVDNASLPGLPEQAGQGLVIFGSGPHGLDQRRIAQARSDGAATEEPQGDRHFAGTAANRHALWAHGPPGRAQHRRHDPERRHDADPHGVDGRDGCGLRRLSGGRVPQGNRGVDDDVPRGPRLREVPRVRPQPHWDNR